MEWSRTARAWKTEGRLAAALIAKMRTRSLRQFRKPHLGQQPAEEIGNAKPFERLHCLTSHTRQRFRISARSPPAASHGRHGATPANRG